MIPTNFLLDLTKIGQKWTPEQVQKRKTSLINRYINDFKYYSTADEIKLENYSIYGLALPEEILYKIFYGNAVKWVPGINKDF